MMKEIPLTKGKVALVDDDDYSKVSSLKWQADEQKSGHWYAVHSVFGVGKVRMHRFILGLPFGRKPIVDHRDRDGLNNQKLNLRVCTFSQNGGNRKPKNESRYKGTYFRKAKRRWVAVICVNGKRCDLGLFQSQELAARAYDESAISHFGEYARLNFPR